VQSILTSVNAPLLGIEIGGTKLQLVAGHGDGTIIERQRFKVDVNAGAAGIRDQIQAQLSAWRGKYHFAAVGVGFGGPMNWQTGVVATSHQVAGWSGFDIKGWMAGVSGTAVAVDNDANVAGLGEAISGAGRGYRSMFYTTLGSGVGGALVLDGKLYHGTPPGECEIGHLRLNRAGQTVESLCSGWAVDTTIRHLPEHERGGALWQFTRGMHRGEALKLVEALKAGDPAAERIVSELGQTVAFALSHVTHLLHPEILVVGGGLSGIGEPLRAEIARFLPQYLMEVFRPGPKVVLTKHGEDVVPVGALHLAAGAGTSRPRTGVWGGDVPSPQE
jgi:glucokinase